MRALMLKLSLSLKLIEVGTNSRQRIQRKWIFLAFDTLNLLLFGFLSPVSALLQESAIAYPGLFTRRSYETLKMNVRPEGDRGLQIGGLDRSDFRFSNLLAGANRRRTLPCTSSVDF